MLDINISNGIFDFNILTPKEWNKHIVPTEGVAYTPIIVEERLKVFL